MRFFTFFSFAVILGMNLIIILVFKRSIFIRKSKQAIQYAQFSCSNPPPPPCEVAPPGLLSPYYFLLQIAYAWFFRKTNKSKFRLQDQAYAIYNRKFSFNSIWSFQLLGHVLTRSTDSLMKVSNWKMTLESWLCTHQRSLSHKVKI